MRSMTSPDPPVPGLASKTGEHSRHADGSFARVTKSVVNRHLNDLEAEMCANGARGEHEALQDVLMSYSA